MTALGPCDDHISLPAAALGAGYPLAPIADRYIGAISLGYLGRVGLDLMAARLAPDDKAHACRSRVPERHRRPDWRAAVAVLFAWLDGCALRLHRR